MTKVKNAYVDNRSMLLAIIGHKSNIANAVMANVAAPVITNYLGECIFMIADRLLFHPRFLGYTSQWKEEMRSDAIENMIVYFNNFKPVVSNSPFNYFTTIAWQAFERRLQKEQRQRYTTYKNFQETTLMQMTDTDLVEFLDDSQTPLAPQQFYDNIQSFMAEYERYEAIRKERRELQKRKKSAKDE